MRRKNKEINIFSMSALDLFASAMGAFILIAVIALPYYLKTDRDLLTQVAELKKQVKVVNESLQVCRQKNEALEADNSELESGLTNCTKQLSETFIAVVMTWPVKDVDIDLHVVDPDGQEFYHENHNRGREHYPSSKARLSKDTIKGPGVEVWEMPVASKGKYEVYYNFYSRRDGAAHTAEISGNIYTNKGSHEIPTQILTAGQDKQKVATIIIGSDGAVSFN